jgi:type IV secretion system protein VirB8
MINIFKKRSAGVGTIVGDNDTQKEYTAGTNKLRQERNRAYLAIGVLLLAIIALAVALAGLTPLKTVEPIVITIDTYSGHVVKTQIMHPEKLMANDALIQHELYEYVRHRNNALWWDRQRLSDYVRVHSSTEVARGYEYEISEHNSNNPYILQGPRGEQITEILGINQLGKGMAQVNFKTIRRRPASEPTIEFWTATIKYSYTGRPLALSDRWENPLGFFVVEYRRDQQRSQPIESVRSADTAAPQQTTATENTP